MGASGRLGNLAPLVLLPLEAARRQKEQWLPGAELVALRERRTRALLARARSAPYYARILSKSSGSNSLDLLQQLPFLDKKTLREHGEKAFLTAGDAGLSAVYTSGSTGNPTRFLRSRMEEAEFSARWYRIYSAYGGNHRDRLLNVGRAGSTPRSGPAKAMRALGILPKICNVSVTAPLEESVRILRDFEPQFITGYAIGIENMAGFVVDRGIALKPPKAALCGAMDVTDRCRDLVDRAFGAPAVNVYVSNEFGVVGWECPLRRGVLHLNDDMLIMEIVDENGMHVPDGATGEVVLTSLTLARMPLIRYRTGDTAARIAEACSCGRGLGLMTPVHGRTSHTIVGPQGQLITAPVVAGTVALANGYEWVRRFQLREQEGNVLLFLVEPHREPLEAQRNDLIAKLASMAGPRFTVRLELRDELPLTPSGKYQYVVPLAQPSDESSERTDGRAA